MRKKYLSALLFGALLVTSAGTFTSCKDYDDEINNLQEQIDVIKADLETLTETVNNLDGVKDMSFTDGKLVIETGSGKKVEVDIPSATGLAEIKLEGNVLYVNGEEAGKVEIPEGETVKVEVKEDGKLYINNEVQNLEIGSKVVMVDNGDGTYTMTVDGKSYVLPKASASVGVELTDLSATAGTVYFTNLSLSTQTHTGGIRWGKANNFKGEWGGLKPVSKGQLLVGQIKPVSVEVSPATFDLTTAELSLVNTLGEKANVIVTPVPVGNEEAANTTGSRAVTDAQGKWELQIAMNDKVTVDNIGSVFANEKNDGNIKYALAVDGKVVTGYDIVVDTDQNVTESTNPNIADISIYYKEKGGKGYIYNVPSNPSGLSLVNLPLGETTLFIDAKTSGATSVDVIYDSYIEIADKDLADRMNITVSGMTINAPEETAGAVTLPIIVHYLDVTGNEIETSKFNITFEASETAGETIKDQEYKLMPTSTGILIDLGNTFTGLTAAQADDLKGNGTGQNGSIVWETTTDAKTFAVYSTTNILNNSSYIKYYATLEDVQNEENNISLVDASAKTIRTIKYAVIPTGTSGSFKANAEAGDNKLTIKLKNQNGNEIKKVSTTLTVTLPTFDEVAEANATNNLWNEAKDTFTTRIEGDKVSIKQAWASKADANGEEFFATIDDNLSYEITYTNVKDEVVTKEIAKASNATGVALTDFVNDKGEMIKAYDVKATLTFFSGTKLSVTKDFKAYVMSIFEGGELKYLKDGKSVEVIDVTTDGLLYNGTGSGDKRNGLFLTFRGKTEAYTQTTGATIDGISVKEVVNNTTIYGSNDLSTSGLNATTVDIAFDNVSAAVGELSVQSGGTYITVKEQGQKGSIKVTFMDNNGVKTDCTLYYESKKSE